jgi:hypothetical protein
MSHMIKYHSKIIQYILNISNDIFAYVVVVSIWSISILLLQMRRLAQITFLETYFNYQNSLILDTKLYFS